MHCKCKHGITANPCKDCMPCIVEDFEMSGCHIPLEKVEAIEVEKLYERIKSYEREINFLNSKIEQLKNVISGIVSEL